jgi:hypothetical protein
VAKLHPLSPEVISCQATINIGKGIVLFSDLVSKHMIHFGSLKFTYYLYTKALLIS